MDGPWRQRGHHYGIVLLLILTTLVFQLAAPDEDWARLTAIVIQGVTLLVALRASRVRTAGSAPRRSSWWRSRSSPRSARTSASASSGRPRRDRSPSMLVALAPLAIARGVLIDFRQQGEITLHTMFGVLCIYLLIGSVFALLFGLVDSLSSTPFFAQRAAPNSHNFLYFSFATITTTGYGDLTAGTDVGRSLAIAEALVGQIYLVTVVAAIVGGLGRRRPPERRPTPAILSSMADGRDHAAHRARPGERDRRRHRGQRAPDLGVDRERAGAGRPARGLPRADGHRLPGRGPVAEAALPRRRPGAPSTRSPRGSMA